jgi:uncharacterized protein (TIGR00725 family)
LFATPPEQPIYIAVIGAGEAGDEVLQAAEEVGRAVARAGATLLSGGLGGTMEAACRGARSEGGRTVGILPGTDRRSMNDHLDVAIPTGLGEMRNFVLVTAADVVIALTGEYGTLSELGFALRIGKPVVGLNTWELSKAGETVDAFKVASSPEEVVRVALDLARSVT